MILNAAIFAFAIYALARAIGFVCRWSREDDVGLLVASWCWFALALLGIPAVLIGGSDLTETDLRNATMAMEAHAE